ncbi:3-hydroxyacyl-[acyl-carrier-protein] dehydratase FabZ [Maioricimonas rarisocia]|uniref:3-hydroxyacyl-[acyl-carrier-protein] dehydratase FabZ n=1 Tax=Maioricimonas rarisocia TaxID=2528026 RepID=A0A517ZB48_9PLAN|nr:3-hydroxyacyl-ACP dehydratase FabZ family protein [Maioricimonas rarisocia]QDU39723.1 3-hydroxyacyl-[acyl-carrier-protein] dehydratase FabZ [Maioricimonas rarisocia]
MRFSLVDRIVALEAGKSVQAVKNLSIAEEYLADHFPGFPVMPGVLMVETLVQAGAWLMRYTEDFRYSTILMKSAKAVKFNNFVSPGKTLHVTCNVIKQSPEEYTFKASGTVDGTSAVSARLVLQQFNLADNNPDLAGSDERRIEKMRELFSAVWRPEGSTTAS